MESIHISLPESMQHFVEECVAEGGYASVSEYVRELIAVDQKRKTKAKLDDLLLDGLNSGDPIPITNDYWTDMKRRLTERFSDNRDAI